jgi:hypothetical protein
VIVVDSFPSPEAAERYCESVGRVSGLRCFLYYTLAEVPTSEYRRAQLAAPVVHVERGADLGENIAAAGAAIAYGARVVAA